MPLTCQAGSSAEKGSRTSDPNTKARIVWRVAAERFLRSAQITQANARRMVAFMAASIMIADNEVRVAMVTAPPLALS
jgi:hypothetical protein